MPAVVVQTWTYPTTALGLIAGQMNTCRNGLPISANDKTAMLLVMVNIVLELADRETANNHTPFVITIDSTAGVAVNALTTALLQKAAPALPEELHDQILHMASPASTRYRILTQDGGAPAQVRLQVYT